MKAERDGIVLVAKKEAMLSIWFVKKWNVALLKHALGYVLGMALIWVKIFQNIKLVQSIHTTQKDTEDKRGKLLPKRWLNLS